MWESQDLLHWSSARAAGAAPEGAGCLWAPEAMYDAEKQAFMVFFASFVQEAGEEVGKHRIYAAHTKDFVNWSPTKKYIEWDRSIIDTTIIRDGGVYYRFSKDENTKRVMMEKGERLEGEFVRVAAPVLEGIAGLEGPECYLLPNGKWCLLCDQFSLDKGYLPIVIEDLPSAQMRVLREDEYDLGKTRKRHGGVLMISDEEYVRVSSFAQWERAAK